jgi:membrane protein YqaA with SNARE-associated domain
MLVAAGWGLAEATLVFIVPDVWLTSVALGDRRQALDACGPAIAGALAGGAVMYYWGRRHPAAAVAAVDAVPGISPATIARVEAALRTRGWWPMVVGTLTAVPYKIFAIKSGALGRPFGAFLVVSLFARALRFVGLVFATSWISAALPDGPLIYRQIGLLAVWGLVYVVYFRKARSR